MQESEFDAMTITSIAEQYDEIKQAFKNVWGGSSKNTKTEVIKYVETLKQLPTDPSNIDLHIKELIKADAVNELVETNEGFKEKLNENYGEWDLERIVAEAESSLLTVSNKYFTISAEPELIGDGMMDEYLNRTVTPNGFLGLPTPYNTLNKLTKGILRKGSVSIINANTGVGKSIFLKSVVKYLGVDLGIPVYFGANEMTKSEQRDRLLTEVIGVPHGIIENGLYNSPDEYFTWDGRKYKTKDIKEKVIEGIKIIEDAPIYLDQIRGFTPEILVQRAKYFKTRYDIEVFAWDYIKRSSAYTDSQAKLRHWLGNCVNVAKEEIADRLDIAFISASQAKVYDPFLSKESAEIQDYCTAFISLRRLSPKEKKLNPCGGDYGVSVLKNRYGAEHGNPESEWIPFDLDQQRLRFVEIVNKSRR